jgi:O-antigen ligase
LLPTTHQEKLRMPSLAGASRRVVRDNLLLPIAFFTSPLATSIAPRLTPFFVAIVGIALIGAALRRGMHWRELLPYQPALAACLVFAAYVFLNATWSADRPAGFGKAALLAGLVLMTFAAVGAAATLEKRILRRAGLAFAAGGFLGALFVAFELFTDGLATRTAMNLFPLLQSSSPKHVRISAGEVTALNMSKLDQNVNLAMFHLWPGLLALMALKGTGRTIAMILFFVAIAAAVAISKHDSSQVALIGSSMVVILAWTWRRLVIRALAVLWCAAFVFVIPASIVAYQSGLHFATWLPSSAKARIILWQYTAEQTLAQPLLGVGVESYPVLREQQKAAGLREHPEGFVYPRTIGHHAHDIFLQTWYELGAVGALLLALAGATVVMLILLLPASAQPFAGGAFAVFALVGAFAWGMWQSWFMCAVGLVPLYLRVAAAAVEEREASPHA